MVTTNIQRAGPFLAGTLFGLLLASLLFVGYIFVTAKDQDIHSANTVRDDQTATGVNSTSRQISSEQGVGEKYLEGPNSQQVPETESKSIINDAPLDAATAWHNYIKEHVRNTGTISDGHVEALQHLATNWVEQEGIDAIQSISTSLEADLRLPVLDHVLINVAKNNPQLALDSALGIRQAGGNRLVEEVVFYWAGVDPKSVLFRVAQVSLDQDTLEGLQHSIVTKWAYQSPETLIKDYEQIPDDLRMYGLEVAIGAMASDSPESASQYLNLIRDDIGNKRAAAREIANQWVKRNVSDAFQWVRTSRDVEEFRSGLEADILRSLARMDTPTAFNMALEQPIKESEIGLEVSVILEAARADITEALGLLDKVRPGATKVAAYNVVGTELAREGNLDGALSLATQLSETDRANFESLVVYRWSNANPVLVLDKIEQLAAESLRSRAALTAWTSGQIRRELSKEQLDKLKSYMNQESLDSLEEIRLTLPNVVE